MTQQFNPTPSETPADQARRARNAFRISIGTAGVMILIVLSFFFLPRYTFIEETTTAILVIGLASLISAWLARRGRIALGIGLIISALNLAILVTAYRTSGLGFPMLAISMTLTLGLTSATLPRSRTTWLNAMSFIVGLIVTLADLFEPFPRASPANPAPAWIMSGGLMLVYAILVLRQFQSYSLRTKLVIVLIATALLPLGMQAAISSQNLRNTLTQIADQTLLSIAAQTAASIDAFLNAQLTAINTEAQLADLTEYLELPTEQRSGSPLESKVTAYLNTLAQKNQRFVSSYAILDRNGIDIIDTYRADIGLDKSNRDYFTEPMRAGAPYVTGTRYSPTAIGVWGIYFSAPIRDPQGENIGVLRVRYKADILQNLVQESTPKNAQGLYIVVVDEDYIRIAHSSNPELIGKLYAPPDPARLAELQAAGRVLAGTVEEVSTNLPEMVEHIKNIDQEPIFSAAAAAASGQVRTALDKTKIAPWIVLARQPETTNVNIANTQTRGTITLALFIAALAAGGAVALSLVLAGPITRLTQTAAAVALGDLSARAAVETSDEIGSLATAFNAMTVQIQQTLANLEQRVADRTRALELSAEVSRRLSTILDQRRLIIEVVEQLQSTFNYYHVHIYLYDEAREYLIMAGGSGEVGQILLERGHKIPHGRGLVGRAAETQTAVLVPDVTQEPAWLPNPLLPETRSEVAVPILVGETVLGVLDVQQTVVWALQQNDADLLQSIANQVAIALQNARAYAQTQRQLDREALIGAISQKILAATTIQEALQVAARELGRAVGAPYTSVKLNLAQDNTPESADKN
jgi:putative methionine-R-sulfoxide reductase with GAF domain